MIVRVADIINHAAEISYIPPEVIKSSARKTPIMRARLAVYLVASETADADGNRIYSLNHIGRYIGGRDHSTIIHGVEQAKNLYERIPEFKRMVDRLREAVANHQPGYFETGPILEVIPDKRQELAVIPPVKGTTYDTVYGTDTDAIQRAEGTKRFSAALAAHLEQRNTTNV